MLNIDSIRNSMSNSVSVKMSTASTTFAATQTSSPVTKTLDPSEAASMLYASGASGAAKITFSEGNTKPLSIYDLSNGEIEVKLNEMESERQSISYDGMTDAEIFNAIVKRYMDKFGADFSVPNMSRECFDTEDERMTLIDKPRSAMMGELKAAINDWNNYRQIVREASGYSDLSKIEIRARVREKYPEPNTIRDYMLMKWEMQELGVGQASGLDMILLTKISGNKWTDDVNVWKKLWDSLLDIPASFDSLEKIESDFEQNGRVIEVMEDVDIGSILDLLGTSLTLSASDYERFKERMTDLLMELLS